MSDSTSIKSNESSENNGFVYVSDEESRISDSNSQSTSARNMEFVTSIDKHFSLQNNNISLSNLHNSILTKKESPSIHYDKKNSIPPENFNEYVLLNNIKPISELLTNEELINRIGNPLCFAVGIHYAVGTNQGKIWICDETGLVKVILGKQSSYYGLVSSLSFSADNTRLVVGYSDGYVVVWVWEKALVESVVKPTELNLETDNSHTIYSPITHVAFIGISRHRFISADVYGKVIHHQIFDNIVMNTLKSKSIYNHKNQPQKEKEVSFFLDIETIHFGNKNLIIDKLGIVILATTPDMSIYAIDICSTVETMLYKLEPQKAISQPWVATATGIDMLGCFRYSIIPTKGKIYVFTENEVLVLKLKTWIERILSAMDDGRFVEAITLSTGLYRGDSGQVVVGLPPTFSNLKKLVFTQLRHSSNIHTLEENYVDFERKSIIGPKLNTLVQASLKFIFSAKYSELSSSSSSNKKNINSQLSYIYDGLTIDEILRSLLVACVEACIATKKLDFLLKDVFELVCTFPKAELIFLEVLEPFIENGVISKVSPQILQSLLKSYSENSRKREKLEECLLLIDLEPHTEDSEVDIDGILSTCKMWNMWRALSRIWIDVINDPVTPLNNLVDSLKPKFVEINSSNQLVIKVNGFVSGNSKNTEAISELDVLFEVLECVLCGLTYPSKKKYLSLQTARKMAQNTLKWLIENINSNDFFKFKDSKHSNYTVGHSNEDENVFSDVHTDSDTTSPTKYTSPKFSQEQSYNTMELDYYNNLSFILFVDPQRILSLLLRVINHPFSRQILFVITNPENIVSKDNLYTDFHSDPEANVSNSETNTDSKIVKPVSQAFCDTILDVLYKYHSKAEYENHHSKSEIKDAFNFDPEKMCMMSLFIIHVYTVQHPSVNLSDESLNFLINCLCTLKTGYSHDKCETAILNLFKIYSPRQNMDNILESVQAASFYKVLRSLYLSSGNLDLVLKTYLDDPGTDRKYRVFKEINSILKNKDLYTKEQIDLFIGFIAENIINLSSISTFEFGILVEDNLNHFITHSDIIDTLNANKDCIEYELSYLDFVLNFQDHISRTKKHYRSHFTAEYGQENLIIEFSGYKLCCTTEGVLYSLLALPTKRIQDMCDRYIELLAVYYPERSLVFIKRHTEDHVLTRILNTETILNICSRNGLLDSVAWIYIKNGNFGKAIQVYLSFLEEIVTKHLQDKKGGLIETTSTLPDYKTNKKAWVLGNYLELPLTNKGSDYLVENYLKQIIDNCLYVCSIRASSLTDERTLYSRSPTEKNITDENEITVMWKRVLFTLGNIILNMIKPLDVKDEFRFFFTIYKNTILKEIGEHTLLEYLIHLLMNVLDSFFQTSIKLSIAAPFFKNISYSPKKDSKRKTKKALKPNNISLEKETKLELSINLISCSNRQYSFFNFVSYLVLFGGLKNKAQVLTLSSRISNCDIYSLATRYNTFANKGWRPVNDNSSLVLRSSIINEKNVGEILNKKNGSFQENFLDNQSYKKSTKWRCKICSGMLLFDTRADDALQRLSKLVRVSYSQITLETTQLTSTKNTFQKSIWNHLKHLNHSKNNLLLEKKFQPRTINQKFQYTKNRFDNSESNVENQKQVIIFACGHSFHLKCLEQAELPSELLDHENSTIKQMDRKKCYICK
ncbi:hypothetical protein BB558_004070 [Smittium angustum]|uniref:Uncharacterized protein n=1 Tax=Smittium angustum TaxID=133377 RepID=A0A2U1J4C5_SMIAN|nr:hypothetical protein BB558_004070 [Smittium angustum]